ncbi:MAG: alpha/beta fold hydrolase [Desulfobacteraceae bacterium]|jgi:predicted alpha/beta-fold hydrolase|nr:MAG: alpha/beta fold hydrolase [Desulfobacteraceae bacterium]
MKDYNPPSILRNRHVQTILNSLKLRKPLVVRRAKGMLAAARSHILDCGRGVRLQGFYSPRTPPGNDLCILIHGWEGSADSMYLVSAAGFLWNKGFDVLRLNLRDHGKTHHLNRDLFHSCRIAEVVGAVKTIEETFPHRRLLIGGFSLGGNFALRVAVRAPGAGIRLDHAAAVCPVLYPPHTMFAMENGLYIYHHYFMKKWRKSIAVKQKCFPDIKGLDRISRFKSISAMTQYFVARFSEFPSLDAYLNGYAITGDALSGLNVPATIIISNDDPVIPADDLNHLARPQHLEIILTKYGGHCGFFEDHRLTSWAEKTMGQIFAQGTGSGLDS